MLDNIKELRQEFIKAGSTQKSGNAYVGIVYMEAKSKTLKLRDLGRGPCHGALQVGSLQYDSFLQGLNTPEYILSQVQKLLVSEGDAKGYIEWLVQRSPWNEVFITKDVDDILKLGYVARTDLPNNFVAGAMVATRFITEGYTQDVVARFPVYKEFIAAGCSETEAYVLAHTYAKEGKKPYPLLVQPLCSGHTAISVDSRSEDYFKRFISANPDYKGLSFKEMKGYENKIYDTWGKISGRGFKDFYSSLRPRSGKVTVNHNIFEKRKTDTYYINNQDELKDIVSQIKEQLYA